MDDDSEGQPPSPVSGGAGWGGTAARRRPFDWPSPVLGADCRDAPIDPNKTWVGRGLFDDHGKELDKPIKPCRAGIRIVSFGPESSPLLISTERAGLRGVIAASPWLSHEWEDEQAHDRNAMQCPAPACFARINLRVHLPASLAGVWGCNISHGSMSSTGNVVLPVNFQAKGGKGETSRREAKEANPYRCSIPLAAEDGSSRIMFAKLSFGAARHRSRRECRVGGWVGQPNKKPGHGKLAGGASIQDSVQCSASPCDLLGAAEFRGGCLIRTR
ncbi:predicted protein [Histoplasma mississippiense (nom. inval.)]|uniref:predicted protein n=1 Tax=Ajellomyces capsulatus (strain NAm1 / WU24) TaxID=2059318 RepID=UPI000157C08E|nr:predicted protein [Histoplasma mississippiense (nom. inval.)]EDN06648.1 predicted protein [Histoplasma mississippiense (nom. inval.)]